MARCNAWGEKKDTVNERDMSNIRFSPLLSIIVRIKLILRSLFRIFIGKEISVK